MTALSSTFTASPTITSGATAPTCSLGSYELIERIARGGMGTVYLARRTGKAGFQRLFAVKVMHAHLAVIRDFVAMLYDEARFAARIHHPNVASIVDLGSRGDVHYVVMDYVEGPTLGSLLSEGRGKHFVGYIAQVLIDTLEGLHAAHTLTDEANVSLNLVHRDVSPHNILVGSDGAARIADFGVAKANGRIGCTRPDIRKGKLPYIAPEQITTPGAVDRRADIWAAGVVFWMALTGRPLFHGSNDAATIHNVLHRDIPAPSRAAHRLTAAFDAVVLQALERNPRRRFASALEMAEAIRAVALQNGSLTSKSQISSWVVNNFGDELRRRRVAVRQAGSRRDEVPEDRSHGAASIPLLPSAYSESYTTTDTTDPSGFPLRSVSADDTRAL